MDYEQAVKIAQDIEAKSLDLCNVAITNEQLREFLADVIFEYFCSEEKEQYDDNLIHKNLEFIPTIQTREDLNDYGALKVVLEDMVPSFDLCTMLNKKAKEVVVDLSKEYKALCDARNVFVPSHQNLIHYVSRRFKFHPTLAKDVINEGHLALIRASEKYNYRVGTKFSAYAINWLRAAFMAFYNDSMLIKTTRSNSLTAKKVKDFTRAYESKYNETPSAELIADNINRKKQCVDRVVTYMSNTSNIVSFNDYGPGSDHDMSMASEYGNEAEIMDGLSNMDIDEVMKEIFDEVDNETLKMVVKMRFGMDPYDREYSSREVAEQLGCTRQWVDMLVNKFIKAVRQNTDLQYQVKMILG